MEFLRGRPLTPDELEMLRLQLESGFDQIDRVEPEVYGIVRRNWPHLLAKLPPEPEE